MNLSTSAFPKSLSLHMTTRSTAREYLNTTCFDPSLSRSMRSFMASWFRPYLPSWPTSSSTSVCGLARASKGSQQDCQRGKTFRRRYTALAGIRRPRERISIQPSLRWSVAAALWSRGGVLTCWPAGGASAPPRCFFQAGSPASTSSSSLSTVYGEPGFPLPLLRRVKGVPASGGTRWRALSLAFCAPSGPVRRIIARTTGRRANAPPNGPETASRATRHCQPTDTLSSRTPCIDIEV